MLTISPDRRLAADGRTWAEAKPGRFAIRSRYAKGRDRPVGPVDPSHIYDGFRAARYGQRYAKRTFAGRPVELVKLVYARV